MVEDAHLERAEHCTHTVCVYLDELRDLCEDARTHQQRAALRALLEDIRDVLEDVAAAAR